MKASAKRAARLASGLLTVIVAAGCASVGGRLGGTPPEDPARAAPMVTLEETPEEFLRNATGIYVVVDLDANRLRVMDGEVLLWDAPVGTGTGLRLQGDDGEWHFSTPRGVFQIQYKEELPVWFLPDWYFVEKGLPVPADNAPQRRQTDQLGVAAVYLGQEIAIHGTDRPELLGQRVSHGCIRLENRYAQRLYHNVQVGTPVVVVGGEALDDVSPGPTTDPGRPKPKPRDPLAGVATNDLLRRLDRELAAAEPGTGWVPVASRLITRGLRDDAVALRGLLARAGTARAEALDREYATFLADVFARGSLRTVVSLARIEPAQRKRAAEAIVQATMKLYGGDLNDERAPWPTRRVPASRLGPAGRDGWEAIQAAEEGFRASRLAGAWQRETR